VWNLGIGRADNGFRAQRIVNKKGIMSSVFCRTHNNLVNMARIDIYAYRTFDDAMHVHANSAQETRSFICCCSMRFPTTCVYVVAIDVCF